MPVAVMERNEEVILKKSAYFLLWLSWKRYIMHAYQVSPPCMLQLESLRSEEVKVLEAIACCGRHGIHM